MRELQRQNLAPWLSKSALSLGWMALMGWPAERDRSVLQHELVDAFRCTGFKSRPNEPKNCVDYRGGRFCGLPQPLSTVALAQYLQQLNTTWLEGYRTR